MDGHLSTGGAGFIDSPKELAEYVQEPVHKDRFCGPPHLNTLRRAFNRLEVIFFFYYQKVKSTNPPRPPILCEALWENEDF